MGYSIMARWACCAMVLTAIVGCQSEPKKKEATTKVEPKTEYRMAPIISIAEAKEVEEEELPTYTRSYDIRHLVSAIPDFPARTWFSNPGSHAAYSGGGSFDQVQQSLFEEDAYDEESLSRGEMIGQVQDMTRDSIDPDNWRSAGGLVGSISEVDGVLYITQTEPNHHQIESLLKEFARQRYTQVAVDVVTYGMPAAQAKAVLNGIGHGSALKPDAADALVNRLNAAEGAVVFSQLRLACYNAQRISATDASYRSVVDLDPVVSEQIAAFDPETRTSLNLARPGTIVDVRPTLRPDADEVAVELRMEINLPHPAANAAAAEPEKLELGVGAVLPIPRIDARIVTHRTSAHFPVGGGVVLVNLHGDDAAMITLVRAARDKP